MVVSHGTIPQETFSYWQVCVYVCMCLRACPIKGIRVNPPEVHWHIFDVCVCGRMQVQTNLGSKTNNIKCSFTPVNRVHVHVICVN